MADHIFSFEPFHVVREKMEGKLRHANVHNVTIFPVALGAENETASFHPPTGANQGTGTLGHELPSNASREAISVTVCRGDDLFAASRLPAISLLKMDVENYELHVLRGLRETLRRDRPPILVEIRYDQILRPGGDFRAALDELIYPDHCIYAVANDRSGRYSLRPFGATRPTRPWCCPQIWPASSPTR